MLMENETRFVPAVAADVTLQTLAASGGSITLAAVTKRFASGLAAVDNVDLRIEPGTYCCLLGPSGCGKTTLLRMIAGHETPTGGVIRIDGADVTGRSPRQRGTAMMFQSYALFPHLSVRDNVAFALRARGVNRKERLYQADAVIEKVQLGLLAERYPVQLSGGQQQRVALARAIILKPKVLLLDEPLSALDEFLRLQMRGELRSMQRELGITFVHVTHTQLEAIGVADQVVVMEKGRIAQSASPREIYARPRTEYVAHFMGGQNVLRGVMVASPVSGLNTITLSGPQGSSFILRASQPSPADGESIAFAVRRDRIGVRPAVNLPARAVNAVHGTVRQLEYQGIYMKVTLTLNEPGEPPCVVYVEESTFFARPVEVGQQVICDWPSEEAHRLTTT